MGRDSGDPRERASATQSEAGSVASGASTPEVIAALRSVRGETVRLAEATARAWSLSDAQLQAAVAAGAAARSALDGAWLGLVRALDERSPAPAGGQAAGPVGAPGAGGRAKAFLVEALRFSPSNAAADVAAAHALDPDAGDLPGVGAALREGAITRAHADAAVRVARDLPRRLATAVLDPESGITGMAAADSFLAEHAREQSPRTVAWLGEQLLARLAPDRKDRYDPDALIRRQAARAWDSTGMLRGSFQMDGAAGAAFAAVWDALAAPNPAGTAVGGDGQHVLVRDERTRGVRLVDALSAMSRLAASAMGHTDREPAETGSDGEQSADRGSAGRSGSCGVPDGPAAPAQVAVVASLEQVAAVGGCLPQGSTSAAVPAVGLAHQHTANRGPISSWLLERLSCNAILQRVLLAPGGAVLDLGRRVRLASPSQRRALSARDGGCVVAGCSAPPENCDLHHVIPWSVGGPTALHNLAMLCPRHHTAVHAGHWKIHMRDGVPWAVPPPWIDHRQRPLRNTTHQTARSAHRLGDQLRLILDTGSGGGRAGPDGPDP